MTWLLTPRRPAAQAAGGTRHARGLAARAVAVFALAASTAGAAGAQSGTLTFNGLGRVDDSGVRYVNNCYEEAGFRFTSVGLPCGGAAAFGTWTADNPLFYTGSPALFNNLGPSVDISATGGQTFSLQSVGLAPLLGAFGNPATVLFTGMLAGGGAVTQTFSVPGGTNALTAYSLTGFTNLMSARYTVSAPDFEPYVQLDNVAYTLGGAPPAVIPEPATVALVGAGLLAVAGGARARRRATSRTA